MSVARLFLGCIAAIAIVGSASCKGSPAAPSNSGGSNNTGGSGSGGGGGSTTLTATYIDFDMLNDRCRRPPAASGLPGWIDCAAETRVRVNRATSSGYVSASFAYPDSGSFYHGEAVASAAGEITIRMVNNYIPRCPPFPYTPTLTIRDGRQATGGPVLLTRQLTFNGGCTNTN